MYKVTTITNILPTGKSKMPHTLLRCCTQTDILHVLDLTRCLTCPQSSQGRSLHLRQLAASKWQWCNLCWHQDSEHPEEHQELLQLQRQHLKNMEAVSVCTLSNETVFSSLFTSDPKICLQQILSTIVCCSWVSVQNCVVAGQNARNFSGPLCSSTSRGQSAAGGQN